MKIRGKYAVPRHGVWWVPLDTPYLAVAASIGWDLVNLARMN